MDTPMLDATVQAAERAARQRDSSNYEPVTIDQLMILTPEQKSLDVLLRIEVLLLNLVKLATTAQRPAVTPVLEVHKSNKSAKVVSR